MVVDAVKITMNILQKNSSEFFGGISECSWSSLGSSVGPGERASWLKARLVDVVDTCEHLLLRG